MIEVVPALAAVVGDLVDLADDFAEFRPSAEVVLAVNEDLALHLLADLHGSQALLSLDGLSDQTSSLYFDAHKLQHIQPLEGAPTGIELEQILPDFPQPCLQAGTGSFLRDLPIKIPETVLQLEKLDHEPAAVIQNVLRKRVLLAIDPQIRKSYISPPLPSCALSSISVR